MIFNKLEDVNKYQFDVSKLEEKVISDPDSVDLHDVMIAMAKATESFQLTKKILLIDFVGHGKKLYPLMP